MREPTGRDRMKGVANSLGIDIEFENEPVLPARRIVRERLPKARAGGAHAIQRKIGKNISIGKRK